MVINSSDTFFSMIDDFDPNDKVLLENIGDVLIQAPKFSVIKSFISKINKISKFQRF